MNKKLIVAFFVLTIASQAIADVDLDVDKNGATDVNRGGTNTTALGTGVPPP